MILRDFDPTSDDADRLHAFACSSGQPHEDDVEEWIRTSSIAWLNDVPRAEFQRRALALIEDHGEIVAVAAWQDIMRVDLEGIWLQVLAVDTSHQHSGHGRRSLDLVVERLRTTDRDGDHLAGLVHPENHRSSRLLAAAGWSVVAVLADHELWVAQL